MATWQFDAILVPREQLSAPSGAEPRVPVEAVEGTEWWAKRSLPVGYESRLDAALPRLPIATKGIMSWGTDDGDRVDVCLEDARVVEVRARFDAREAHPAFAELVATFAEWANAMFVTEEGEIVEADAAALLRELRNSSAHRFAVDPETYLDELGNSGTTF